MSFFGVAETRNKGVGLRELCLALVVGDFFFAVCDDLHAPQFCQIPLLRNILRESKTVSQVTGCEW